MRILDFMVNNFIVDSITIAIISQLYKKTIEHIKIVAIALINVDEKKRV